MEEWLKSLRHNRHTGKRVSETHKRGLVTQATGKEEQREREGGGGEGAQCGGCIAGESSKTQTVKTVCTSSVELERHNHIFFRFCGKLPTRHQRSDVKTEKHKSCTKHDEEKQEEEEKKKPSIPLVHCFFQWLRTKHQVFTLHFGKKSSIHASNTVVPTVVHVQGIGPSSFHSIPAKTAVSYNSKH